MAHRGRRRRNDPAPPPPGGLPPIIQSPATGDFGFSDYPWLRLDHQLLGLPGPAVMFHIDELRGRGYTPEGLGMASMRALAENTPRGQLAQIPDLDVMADMKSPYDVDLYEPDPVDMNHPVLIIGGVFQDLPPADWWERVHRDSTVILIANDTRAAILNSPQFDLLNGHIGVVKGLVVRGYDTGIGTKMPGTE